MVFYQRKSCGHSAYQRLSFRYLTMWFYRRPWKWWYCISGIDQEINQSVSTQTQLTDFSGLSETLVKRGQCAGSLGTCFNKKQFFKENLKRGLYGQVVPKEGFAILILHASSVCHREWSSSDTRKVRKKNEMVTYSLFKLCRVTSHEAIAKVDMTAHVYWFA